MPSVKRKTDGPVPPVAKRGKVTAPEDWSTDTLVRYLSSLGLDAVAEKFEEQDIDGKAALSLSGDDLKDMQITQLGERKKTEAAIEAMGHPLLPVFQGCDVDGNFRIDTSELSSVMSDINGAPANDDEVVHACRSVLLQPEKNRTVDHHVREHAWYILTPPLPDLSVLFCSSDSGHALGGGCGWG